METIDIETCTDEKILGAIGYQCVLNIEHANNVIQEQKNIRARIDNRLMKLAQERQATNGAQKVENA